MIVNVIVDGIATRVHFGIKVESDVELDNVILWVEARDARGRILARKRLAKRPRILYRWRPEETFELNVLKGGMEGAPHLILESNQGVFKNPSPVLLRQDAR